jgi:lipopolysaccharide transport system permease protein
MNFNLLYHINEVIRAPLLGKAPSALTYEVTIAMAIVGWAITMFIYARFRRRIAFWL